MNLSSRIIKAQNVNLVDSKEKVKPKFIKINFQTKEDDISKESNDVEAEIAQIKIEAEIAQIKKEAEKKIKIAEKKAYDRGFLKGLQEGTDQEKRKISTVLESITKITKDFRGLKEEYFKNSEKDIVELIFLIAKKVIHKEVSLSKDIILAVVRDAMKSVRDKKDIKITLNPKDYNYIMETQPNFFNNFCDMKNILIEKDEGIGQGGAVIETHSGGIDARLDQQLSKIEERLSSEG